MADSEIRDWYSTVVFKGSDGATKASYAKISNWTSVGSYTEDALQRLGVKDVLAVLELYDVYNESKGAHVVEPNENLLDASKVWGVGTTIYTDASLPNKK